MDSSSVLAYVNRYIQITDEERDFFESVLIARPFKQGELLVQSGDHARYMLFVNAGFLMTYYTGDDGADHVLQFAAAGWWCGDIYSVSEHTATRFSTRSLSDGEVLLLPRLAHHQLLEKYPVFEKYFRILFQNSVLRHQLRIVESHSSPAEERYRAFTTAFAGIEQYVAQKYIASYLGITPEFLSRIRKKLSNA